MGQFLGSKFLSYKGQLIKEKKISLGSKFFSLRVDPIAKGDKNENDRVSSS